MTASAATPLDSAALLRLLHLCSPALPIGAFAYSQGLEPAVAAGWVKDESSAERWIEGVLVHGLGQLDVPVFARLHAAFRAESLDSVDQWTDFLAASRGSAELQSEDRRLGGSLARVLVTLGIEEASAFVDRNPTSLLTVFALAAARWQLDVAPTITAWLFSWCENQVAAALRLVPLGQSSGLRILEGLQRVIPSVVTAGLSLPNDDLGWGCPALPLASALHETQYSRLFRS